MAEISKSPEVHAPGSFSDDMAKPSSVDAGQADVAVAYTGYFAEHEDYSRKEEVTLRWKLDRRVLPILWFNIILGATDKVATSTGALYGMREDTDSTGDRYSWLGSAFYFGYLFWCFPAASLRKSSTYLYSVQMVACILSRGIASGDIQRPFPIRNNEAARC